MTRLDALIKAYRENPTEANRLALLAAQNQQTQAFYSDNSNEYIRRTRDAGKKGGRS